MLRYAQARFGFTLIELLVVIAIIAVLAGILFPVFSRVREKARAITCLSNEKQIGLAMMMYTQDYDEGFPQGGCVTSDSNGCWAGQVYPYLKNTGVLRCPDDSPLAVVSYAINTNLGDYYNTWTHHETAHATQSVLGAPSATVMFSEITNNWPAPGSWVAPLYKDALIAAGKDDGSPSTFGQGAVNVCMGPYPLANGWYGGCQNATGYMSGDTIKNDGVGGVNAGSPGVADIVAPRHSGGSNFVLCDGHAKWYPSARVSAGQNEPVAEAQSWKLECGAIGGQNATQYSTAAPTEYLGDSQYNGQGSGLTCSLLAITYNID